MVVQKLPKVPVVQSLEEQGQRPWASIQPPDICDLSEISPTTQVLWDGVGGLPRLIKPSSCFTPSAPSLEELWIELVLACKSHPYDIFRKDTCTDDLSDSEKERLYAKALFHAQKGSTQGCGLKVLNIWKHGLRQRMILPATLSQLVLEDSVGIACNITPPGTTGFHHGKPEATPFTIRC